MQRDGHDDANGSFCDYVNTPKNALSYIQLGESKGNTW